MGKKNPVLSEEFKEYRYPVGFSMKMHPTLRSPNPASLPNIRFYLIQILNQENVLEVLRDFTYSTEEFVKFRSPIQTLIYGMIYRNIGWDKIINTQTIKWLESIDYNIGTMYAHLDVNVIYSRVSPQEEYFNEERIQNDFKDYMDNLIMMNTQYEYFSESPYLECNALKIISSFFKGENEIYEEDRVRITIPEYFYRYLSALGFVRTQSLSDSMVFKRNNLFSFV